MNVEFIHGAGEDFIARARKIRHDVFVVEQNVDPALEWDDKDDKAFHFIGFDKATGKDVATGRLIVERAKAKLQRIAVIKHFRGNDVGYELMLAMLDFARKEGLEEAYLDAQVYAIPFYEKLGFEAYGAVFDDAGIPHRHMKRSL